MEPYQVVEVGNLRLSIKYDDSAESPRDWDNLGTMICWHRRYDLGDKHEYSEPRQFLESLAGNYTDRDTEEMTWEQLYKIIEEHVVMLSIYAYEHGGITINTSGFSCPWDSGQVGFIYATKEEIRKEYSVKRVTKKVREKVLELLDSEVKVYDEYLTGNVYGFVLEKKEECEHCEHVEWEHVDSCWGFIGSNMKENGILDAIQDNGEDVTLLIAEIA